MTNQRVIIITGMHRSGTSLVTKLLQAGGLDIGSELLEANTGNPYGYLEDLEFLEFQRQLLRTRGMDMFVTEAFDFVPTQSEVNRARNLIAKRKEKSLWGWKDPRTSLFLEFWDQLIPHANYIFLYRHPLDVVISLMRRGDFSENGQVELGLRSWCVYNENIFNFYNKNRTKGVLCNIYGLVDNVSDFKTALGQRLELNLSFDSKLFESLYHHEGLRRINLTKNIENALKEIYPSTLDLFRKIENLADLSSVSDENFSTLENLPGLIKHLQSQPGSVEPARVRSLLLMLICMIEPDIFERFYVEVSDNLQESTIKRDHFRSKAQTLSQQVREYEARLQSQDMVTRQFIKLTINNLLDVWRSPKTVMQKLSRWVHFRIEKRNIFIKRQGVSCKK